MKYHETSQFKKLSTEWSKKLKESGFEDIEQDEKLLKSWSNRYFVSKNGSEKRELYAIKAEYYRLAGAFLESHTFSSVLDRQIWELHSQGRSVREIVSELANAKVFTYKDNVAITTKRLRKQLLEELRNDKE